MSKQLLIEYQAFQPLRSSLNEARKLTNGNMLVSGLVQRCNEKNANGRIYPYETLYKQVEKYMQGPIAENRALGELDHPESSVINLKNVSHNIVKLWWDGNDLYGDIEILPTPSGNILNQLFKNGITVGISSRAMGSVTPIGEGTVKVEDDLDLICWDFVSTPSTYGAYVRPVGGLREGFDRSTAQPTNKINQLISDIICSQSGVCCLSK